jgi:hypothetical protein
MPKPPSQTAAAYTEPDFAKIVAKPTSPLQEHFHDWVLEKTGYDPATAKTKAAAFAEGIRLGTALRGIHQASPENQERIAESRAAREAEAVEVAPKAAKATKAAAPAKAAPAAAPAKKAAKKAAPAAAPEAVVPPRKRAPAKKAAAVVVEDDDNEAPF